MSQLALVWDRCNPKDDERAAKLTGDLKKVYDILSDGKAWTVKAIAETLKLPETSCSSHVRHLRKPKFGGFNVQRISITKGLSAYQLIF